MPTNAQKTPLVEGLNSFVSNKQLDASELIGKALPASIFAVDPSNTIVTVNFEVKTERQLPIIQCPIGFPEWIRFPIKKGDFGFVVSVDCYMGAMSGLGKGVATMSQLPNLSTLVWFPCGNIGNDPVQNPNAVEIYGPDGTILRDRGNNGPGYNGSSVQIKIDSSGNVTIWGFKTLTTDCGGYGSRVTNLGGGSYVVDNYTIGSVTVNNLPVHPPMIPPP